MKSAASCVCTNCCGCVKVPHMILFREHARSLRNYFQQSGICHPDFGKQTIHAFTLVLEKIEDRIYFARFREEIFRYT